MSEWWRVRLRQVIMSMQTFSLPETDGYHLLSGSILCRQLYWHQRELRYTPNYLSFFSFLFPNASFSSFSFYFLLVLGVCVCVCVCIWANPHLKSEMSNFTIYTPYQRQKYIYLYILSFFFHSHFGKNKNKNFLEMCSCLPCLCIFWAYWLFNKLFLFVFFFCFLFFFLFSCITPFHISNPSFSIFLPCYFLKLISPTSHTHGQLFYFYLC